MSSYKSILVAIIFSVMLFGCGASTKKQNHNSSDSTGYIAPPPGNISPEDFNRYYTGIKEYYEKHLVGRGFNGGILVAKKGRIIFEDYHGFFNLQKKDSLNAHSAFHLASVSKTFTAMAVLKLAEMGKLSLEDSLQKFFPAFPYDNITVKLLLNHRSGLPNY
ncbi:MAG TPA: serine hydrolase domain-containing protein, partial [Hanamia sp.]|nr:serine hydrolase domain-containing protein [Hanamia sp.]